MPFNIETKNKNFVRPVTAMLRRSLEEIYWVGACGYTGYNKCRFEAP